MSNPQAICHRCAALLERGKAELYIVQIRAHADPQLRELPDLSADQLANEIKRLIDEASRQSETEYREQVHTEFEIILCNECYRDWIENPTG